MADTTPWKQYCDTESIVFHAACNEAVEPVMRPVHPSVVHRLVSRILRDLYAKETLDHISELVRLFTDHWNQATINFPRPEQRGYAEKNFIELLATDPRWKAWVLDTVVLQRRWDDFFTGKYEKILDRLFSLLEKVVSPHHPVTQRGTAAFVSAALGLVALWLPTTLNPNFYKDKFLSLNVSVLGDKNEVPVRLKLSTDETPVKVRVDMSGEVRELNPVIKPILKPETLPLTLQPNIEASLRIIPFMQYPPRSSTASPEASATQPGVPVHFVPDGDMFLVPKHLLDGNSPIRVSVQELEGQSEPQSKQSSSATPVTAPERVQSNSEKGTRPLDRIGDNLDRLGNELQASSRDSDTSLGVLQQNQNRIHTAANNEEHVRDVEVRPNSTHSVVLQWFAGETEPESCTLTFKVDEIRSTDVHLSGIKEKCTSGTAAMKNLPSDLLLHPGSIVNLEPWILSVDETHRRWIFLHAATLRFTWQPPPKDRP